MYTCFLLVQLAGITYFGLANRTFDFLSVSFFSSCIYFLPVHFGYVIYPSISGFHQAELLDEAILVMCLVLSAVVIAALIFDFSVRRHPAVIQPPREVKSRTPLIALEILTALGFAMALLRSRTLLIGAPKEVILESLDRWSILWTNSAMLGLTLSYILGRWKDCIFFLGVMLFDMFLGSRVTISISLLSILTISLWRKGRQRLFVKSWKLSIGVLMAALALFSYKGVIGSVRANDLELALEIASRSDTYIDSVSSSEPFITQAILNAVVDYDYRADVRCITDVVVAVLPYATEFGLEARSFNDYFQNALFPGLSFGMANNIWAQMISVGDWPLLLVFITLYSLLMCLLSALLRVRDPLIKSLVGLSGVLWGFYVHRNDLLVQIIMQRALAIIAVSVFAFSIVYHRGLFRRLFKRYPLEVEREVAERTRVTSSGA